MLLLAQVVAWGVLAAGPTAQRSAIDRDEEVIFFPTYAYRVEDGQAWELLIHGWIFERERRAEVFTLFLRRLGIPGHRLPAGERALLAERTALFLVDNQRGKVAPVRIGADTLRPDPSAPGGHFWGRVRLSAARVEQLLSTQAAEADPSSDDWPPQTQPATRPLSIRFQAGTKPGDPRVISGAVQLIEETGVSVISDIDDTIKISDVCSRRALLRRTFLRPFEAVPRMAAVYRSWAERSQASFHYVSASPWQLYPPLARFLDEAGFPRGTFHLKVWRWKDQRFADLHGSPELYKLRTISEILEKYPRRQFVLVGDSGEKDPEAYAALAREHPQQIVRILIRDLDPSGDNESRFREVFAGLPEERWQVFHDALQLPTTLP